MSELHLIDASAATSNRRSLALEDRRTLRRPTMVFLKNPDKMFSVISSRDNGDFEHPNAKTPSVYPGAIPKSLDGLNLYTL